jgi:hypothetical protein
MMEIAIIAISAKSAIIEKLRCAGGIEKISQKLVTHTLAE